MTNYQIDTSLAAHLIATQFPEWRHLAIHPVAISGWDNRTFHLGHDKTIRIPSAADYAPQVAKEQYWLPRLAPHLPLLIPTPLAMGKPTDAYPFHWSVYSWIEGQAASKLSIPDLCTFATNLAHFLKTLHQIDPTGGPQPGAHNFHRGGSLRLYDTQTQQALELLRNKIDTNTAHEVWKIALESSWQASPVWIHGDISPGNLLLKDGHLHAVIDFGMLAVGDPACDLAIAWTLLDDKSRTVLRTQLPLDHATWARGRAWALWKALILAADLVESHATQIADCWRIIEVVLADHEKEFKKNKHSP